MSRKPPPDGDRSTFTRRRALSAAGIAALPLSVAGAATASAQGPVTPGFGINLRSYGAIGDGLTDDTQAFRDALAALADLGGGTLHVPGGVYRLAGGVSQNFTGKASAITIRGTGSASRILVAAGTATTALSLQNLDLLLLETLTFVGTPGQATDARVTLRFEYCRQAVMRDVSLYGVSSVQDGGAVVSASRSNLHIDHCAFLGCGGSSAVETPVVRVSDWHSIVVTDSLFLDWGRLNGVYHSKTPIAPPYAWIRVGNTDALDNALSQGTVTFRRLRMDEGSYRAISVKPDPAVSARIANVEISGLRVNGCLWTDGIGVHVQHADRVTITDCWVGYSTTTRRALNLANVTTTAVERCTFDAGMNIIAADAACGSLTVRDSTYATLLSRSATTQIHRDGVTSRGLTASGAVRAGSVVVWDGSDAQAVRDAPAATASESFAGIALDSWQIGDDAAKRLRVIDTPGVVVSARSDGAAAIAAGDRVGCSPSRAGAVRSISSGVCVGVALQSRPATDGVAVLIRLLPGRTTPPTALAPALESGWSNRGDGYAAATVVLQGSGLVLISGVISGGTVAGGTVLFRLPAGFRPAGNHIFACATQNGTCQILVKAAGSVVVRASASSGFIALDGISFPAAGVTPTP